MNKEEIKIEPINNGFKVSVEIPKKMLDLELNEYLNRIDEINRLIINDKKELYIRALVNRISEAIEYIKHSWWLREIQIYDTSKDLKGWEVEKILEILKGGSNE